MSISIKQDILSKLKTASSYSPSYSLNIATLWDKWFNSLAVRTGTTAEMLYSVVNIDIESASDIAERLDKEIYAPGATALPFLTNFEKLDYISTVNLVERKTDKSFFVTNDDKQPITLYHGSFGDIEEFDKGKIGPFNRLGQAFYFTSSPEDASENYASPDSPELQAKAQCIQSALRQSGVAIQNIDYKKIKESLAENGGAVYPVHLAMKSPFVIADNEPFMRGKHDPAIKMGAIFTSIILENKGNATQASKLYETLEGCRSTKDAVNEITTFGAENNMLGLTLQAIKRSGYDGVIDKTAGELWHTPDDAAHYIVFKPEQVVSALSHAEKPKYESVLYQYAGIQAQYSDQGMLETAKRMQQAGDNEELIRQTTGWHQWIDGQWRFEINDSNAFLNHEQFKETNHHHHRAMERIAGPGKGFMDLSQQSQDRVLNLPPSTSFIGELKDVLYHPGLFNHYPQLKDLLVDFQISPDITQAYGSYQPDTHYAIIRANSLLEALKTTLHEVQHGIQAIEGFTFGGTPEDYTIPTTVEATTIRNSINSALLLLDYVNDRDRDIDLLTAAQELGDLITPETRIMARNCDKSEIERFVNDQRHRLKTPALRYHYLAGEYEARDVESRMNLSLEERLITPPYSSEWLRQSDLEIKINIGTRTARAPLAAVLRDNSKANFMILLSNNANESSFIHESSHVFLDLFTAEALKENAPQCLVSEYETICKYLGNTPGQAFDEAQEEIWARTVEAYFLDNNSIIPEVKRAEQWMKNVYSSVADLGVQPTEEINNVITRMFSESEAEQGMNTDFDFQGLSSQLNDTFDIAPKPGPTH